MWEQARGITIQSLYSLYAQCFEQFRDSDSTRRIDSIDDNLESCLFDGLRIDQRMLPDQGDVFGDVIVVHFELAQFTHSSKIKLFFFCQRQYQLAVGPRN